MGDMKTHFRGLVHGEFEEELDDIDEEAITRWLGESSASDDRPDPDLPEPDVGDLDKRVAVDVNSEDEVPSGSPAEPGDGETTRNRARQCRRQRHHQLYEHVESVRDDRGGPPRS